MTEPQQPSLAAARRLLQQLRAPGDTPAPPTLLQSVLKQIGSGDAYVLIDSPIGTLYIAYNDVGISTVMQAGSPDEFERAFRTRFLRPIRPANDLPATLKQAVAEHFVSNSSSGLPVDLGSLTLFEQAVLLKAREIPRGEVRPYSWIASEIGHPKAVRAVGTALGHNPVPLLIPCHRVVRSDGRIGNYIFGSETKRAVLSAEGLEPDVLESIASAGVRFYADEDDHTFCYPTCGGMYKRTQRHYLKFHAARDAVAAGFQPCAECRPAVGA